MEKSNTFLRTLVDSGEKMRKASALHLIIYIDTHTQPLIHNI